MKYEQTAQATTESSGAFDAVVKRLGETLGTYRDIANRVERTLLRPVPAEVANECKRGQPETVTDALYFLNDDLADVNKRLEGYADILQRHFGGLKLE